MAKPIRNIFLFLIIAALAVWAFIKFNSLPSWKDIFSAQTVAIQNTPVSVKDIRSLAQLVTVSMYEELVVDSSANIDKTLQVPLLPGITLYSSERKLVVIGKVTTQIGIDMNGLTDADINAVGDSIHIGLPPAKMLDAIVNPSDVTVFIEQGEWDNTAIANLKKKIQYLAIVDAESRGLLSQSESKARQILTDFFKAAGYKQVVIQFGEKKTINGIG